MRANNELEAQEKGCVALENACSVGFLNIFRTGSDIQVKNSTLGINYESEKHIAVDDTTDMK